MSRHGMPDGIFSEIVCLTQWRAIRIYGDDGRPLHARLSDGLQSDFSDGYREGFL